RIRIIIQEYDKSSARVSDRDVLGASAAVGLQRERSHRWKMLRYRFGRVILAGVVYDENLKAIVVQSALLELSQRSQQHLATVERRDDEADDRVNAFHRRG